MATRDTVKSLAFGCAFVGLIIWNLVLQTKYDASIKVVAARFNTQDDKLEHHRNLIKSANISSNRLKRSAEVVPPSSGGATYVRWGRTECPNDNELVYKGFAGGAYHRHTGGGSEYLCLASVARFGGFSLGSSGAWITGVELKLDAVTNLLDTTNSQPSKLQNSDVQCVVCRSGTRSSMVMVPGTNDCSPGWTKEYWGYLMSSHYTHKAQINYACFDHDPEAGIVGGERDTGGTGAMMYHVEGSCSPLPCPPYEEGYEISCAVCTK